MKRITFVAALLTARVTGALVRARGAKDDVPDRTRSGVGIHPDSPHDSLVLLLRGSPGLRPPSPTSPTGSG